MGFYNENNQWISTPEIQFSDLIGKTLTAVKEDREDWKLTFVCNDGTEYTQYHSQDCCESVSIDDICGDLEDIIGSPILHAEESVSSERQEWQPKIEEENYYSDESFTWTFYKIDTIKGGVTIRWYGSSNGYYSESVSFYMSKDPNATQVS